MRFAGTCFTVHGSLTMARPVASHGATGELTKDRIRAMREYRGCFIDARNYCGMYSALVGVDTYTNIKVSADTLAGMRSAIRSTLNRYGLERSEW
jgi:hypothetical protein